MFWRITLACGFLCMLICTRSNAYDLDDFAARNAAITSIRSRQTGIEPECPKTRRREHLEEDLFGVRSQVIVDGKLNETYFVYEVVDIGCFAIEDSSLVVHSIDHPGTFGYVVVDVVSGKTYRLWIDIDARNEFNRLMRDLGVSVDDEFSAIRVGRLYRELVLGPVEGNNVYDSFQLRQLAEQSFHSAFRGTNWSRRFDEWWRRFEAAKIALSDEVSRKGPEGWIVTGQAFDGFKLTVPRTVASGSASVVQWSIRVSPDGQVVELPPRLVFR